MKKQQEQQPIIISTANTTETKMKAILNLTEAIKDAARALNSVSTTVNVAHCNFHNTDFGVKVDANVS
jgi:hypothetical protein